jgi:hypothetical protein
MFLASRVRLKSMTTWVLPRCGIAEALGSPGGASAVPHSGCSVTADTRLQVGDHRRLADGVAGCVVQDERYRSAGIIESRAIKKAM